MRTSIRDLKAKQPMGTTVQNWIGHMTRTPSGWLLCIFELKDPESEYLSAERKEWVGMTSFHKGVKALIEHSPQKRCFTTRMSCGWPLVKKDGHRVPSCPYCKSTAIQMGSIPYGAGTGPGGKHRMGDPYRSKVECMECRAITIALTVTRTNPFNNPPVIHI